MGSEEDFDDICNFLRQKVWKALEKFTPSRVRTTSKYSPDEQLERFVYACVQNGKKDVLKKKKMEWKFIEEFESDDTYGVGHGNDWFEARYLVIEETYFVEVDEPTIPSTLDEPERSTALLLYHGFSVDEIAGELGCERRQVRAIVESIRTKMSDWAPAPVESLVVAA